MQLSSWLQTDRLRKQLAFSKLLNSCCCLKYYCSCHIPFFSIASGPNPNQMHGTVHYILYINTPLSLHLSFRHYSSKQRLLTEDHSTSTPSHPHRPPVDYLTAHNFTADLAPVLRGTRSLLLRHSSAQCNLHSDSE